MRPLLETIDAGGLTDWAFLVLGLFVVILSMTERLWTWHR